MTGTKKSQHFGSAKESAKLVRAIATAVHRARLDYEGFRRVSALVRKELGLRRPPRSRRLPRILPEASLKKFYEVIDQAGDLQHQIMLRLGWPPSKSRTWIWTDARFSLSKGRVTRTATSCSRIRSGSISSSISLTTHGTDTCSSPASGPNTARAGSSRS